MCQKGEADRNGAALHCWQLTHSSSGEREGGGMMMRKMMMSVLLADANEWISAGSPRIGTDVNILPKASTLFFLTDLLKLVKSAAGTSSSFTEMWSCLS